MILNSLLKTLSNRTDWRYWSLKTIGLLLVAVTAILPAAAQTDAEKAAKNPIAKKISLEYQSVFQFDYGDEEKTGYVGMFQPVLPLTVGPVNFISRPLIPIIALPEVTLGEDGTIPGLPTPPIGQPGQMVKATGLGDITYQLLLSPAIPGKVIWGIGPALTFPTASDPSLGNGKYAGGPAVVALAQPGNMTLGVLAMNSWSYAGDKDRSATNQFSLQYFIDYGLGNGWSLASSPLLTANWRAKSNRWLVPVGGGVNKMFPGKMPVQIKMHAYWHAARPDTASNWQIMISVQPVILLK